MKDKKKKEQKTENDPQNAADPSGGTTPATPPATSQGTNADPQGAPPHTSLPATPAEDPAVVAMRAELEGLRAEKAAAEKKAEEARLAELSELEAAQERLRQAEARADELEARNAAARQGAAVRASLLAAGVAPARLDAAARIIDVSGVAPGEGGAFTGIDEAVEAAKQVLPELFGAPAPGNTASATTGGGKTPDKTPPATDPDKKKSVFEKMQAKKKSLKL